MLKGQLSNTLKPKSPVYCTSSANGDLDKLVRCTLDGLSVKCGGSVIADDNYVVRLNAVKRYVAEGEEPGASIRIQGAER